MQLPKSIEKAVEVLVCAAPVFKREFIGILRSRMGFWVAVGTVAVTGLVPMLAWGDGGEKPPTGIRAAVWFTPLWLSVASVMVACHVSLPSEIRKATFEQLLVTRLPPVSIIVGRHFAFVAFTVLITLLATPLTVFHLLMFGPVDHYFPEFLVVVVLMSFVPNGYRVQGGPAKRKEGQSAQFRDLYWISMVAFFCAWGWLRLVSAPIRYSIAAVFLVHFAVLGIWSLRRADLRPPLRDAKKPTGLEGLIQSIPAEHRHRFLKSPPMTFLDGVNPIFRLTHGPKHASLRDASPQDYRLTLLLGLFVLGGIVISSILGVTLYAVTGSLLLVSVAGSAATTALLVRAESDQETLENLRATPLTVFEILWGKLAGAFWMPPWRYFYLSAAGVMAVAAVLLPIETHHRVFSFLFIPTLAVVAALGSTAGLLGAALSRDTVQAVILAFAVFLVPLLVVPLLLGPMEPVSRVMSPLVGYYAAVYEYRASNVFAPGAFLLSLPLGLALAGLQFFLAVRLTERKWMRGG